MIQGLGYLPITNKVCMYLSLDNHTDKKGILSPSGVHNRLLLVIVKYIIYHVHTYVRRKSDGYSRVADKG